MTDVSALGIKVTGTGIVKTTNELDRFAIAAREAGRAASKPINVKISGSASKALADLRAMERALNAVRSATKSGVNIRIGSAGNAKAIADLAKMGAALREARAAARTPINVRVTQTGAEAVVTALNRVTAAANRARAASNVNVRASGGGSPAMPVPTSGDIGAVTSLTNAVKGLVTAYGLLQGVKVYATLVDESKMLTAQLKLATAEYGNFAQAQKDVRDIAASSRSDLDSTATLYSKLQINAAQLGLTQKEVATVTEATVKAFKVSGATTVETSNSIRQLIQGLQSGVLRGEEFNSVMEQAPRLQKAIADSLGKSNGELRAMAEEGKLTGAVVTKAILDASEKIRSEFDQIPATFADAMTQIRNAAVITFGAFDEGGEFSKAITSFLIGGTAGMEDMERSAFKLGQTIRTEMIGAAAAFEPLIEKVTELYNLFQQEFSLNLNLDQDYKDIDAFTGWLANQGILGRLLTGNNWNASNPTGTTMFADANRAKAAERQRQNDKVTGGFAGRWLDKAGADGGVWERETKAITANTEAKKKSITAAERREQALKREYEANEVLITGLYASAAAYGTSEAAGRKAQIEAEAAAKGIKKQADAAAYAAHIAQQLRKEVAQQVQSSAESIRSMSNQTAIQEQLNAQVKSGALSAEGYADALAMMNEQRALVGAIKLAELNNDAAGAEKAAKALAALTDEQLRAKKARDEAADIQATAQTNRNIEAIEKETKLQRELGNERRKALRGLSGDALENEMARIADAYEIRSIEIEYDTKIMRENALAHYENAKALEAEKQAV